MSGNGGGGGAVQPIADRDALDAAMQESSCVLFKHSTTCPISRAAYAQMRTLCDRLPDAHVYLVDVHSQKDLSTRITEAYGIRHESPQAFVLRDGAVVWSGSHFAITADAIAQHLAAPRGSQVAPKP